MIKSKFVSIIKTVRYAMKGIAYAMKNERNMRIHLVSAIGVMVFSTFFNMSAVEYTILVLTISLVMMSEMFNSAIEGLIDLCAKEYNTTAKAAKDIAAGGVLIVAMAAVVVGCILFSKKEAYISMWVFFCMNPLMGILGLFLLVIGYLYVFWGPTEIKNKLHVLIRKAKHRISDTDNLGGK